MAAIWISETDLDDVYGEDEVTRAADLDHDGVRDPGVVGKAIVRAEGRVRSRLLTRYQPAEIPAGTGEAPEALRRVAIGLAWYDLHKRFDQISDAVVRVRDDAESELDDLVNGTGSLGLAGNPPADATRPLILTSRSRDVRLTLRVLDDC